MISGCFSFCGDHLPAIMDKFEYINILKKIMLPYAKEEIALKLVFQQDPKYK